MPKLNRHGQIVNGRVTTWLNDTQRVGQVARDGRAFIAVDDVEVDARGANMIAAGAGRWLAFLAGYGVFGPDVHLPQAALAGDIQHGVGAAAPDGTIAIRTAYHGRGLHLLGPDGSVRVDLPYAEPTGHVCAVSRDQVLWMDARLGAQAHGLPVPQIAPGPMYWPFVFRVQGEWWLGYHGESAIYVHPFLNPVGYRLPAGYYVDGVALSDRHVRVVTAADAGDSQVQVHELDLTAPRQDLRRVIVKPPAPPPPPPTKEPTVRTIPPDVWAVVQAVHARVAHTFAATEDGARDFMRVLIGQVVHSFPGQGWCWKSSGPGSPASKDVLARQWEGAFFGWDLLHAAGAQGPRELVRTPTYYDLSGQHPIPVPPRDVLGSAVQPPAAADTHRYDGGGNDDGTCDICGQPRAAAVHAILESRAPHAYDGGEQDTGLCDICGQDGGHALHQADVVVLPPPPPAGQDLEALRAELARLRQEAAETRVMALQAQADAAAALAKASLSLHYGDPIGLRASDGNVVVAHGGGGGAVDARPTPGNPQKQVKGWETFVVERPRG